VAEEEGAGEAAAVAARMVAVVGMIGGMGRCC